MQGIACIKIRDLNFTMTGLLRNQAWLLLHLMALHFLHSHSSDRERRLSLSLGRALIHRPMHYFISRRRALDARKVLIIALIACTDMM